MALENLSYCLVGELEAKASHCSGDSVVDLAVILGVILARHLDDLF